MSFLTWDKLPTLNILVLKWERRMLLCRSTDPDQGSMVTEQQPKRLHTNFFFIRKCIISINFLQSYGIEQFSSRYRSSLFVCLILLVHNTFISGIFLHIKLETLSIRVRQKTLSVRVEQKRCGSKFTADAVGFEPVKKDCGSHGGCSNSTTT